MQSLLLNAGRTSAKEIETIENVIINGDFQIAQQGTTFPAASGYTLDQWNFFNNTGSAYTAGQGVDIPSVAQAGVHAGNNFFATCTTAASFSASTTICIIQPIKGSRFRKIAQKPFVLSFWVRSSRAGIYCICFRNGGMDRRYVAEYTINAADTWERKIIVVPTSPSDGTWDYANGIGLSVLWTLAGAPGTAPVNTWSSNTSNYTANQVNHAQVSGNVFRLALVKIEPGIIATPFPVRDQELLLCQEYYCRARLSACSYAVVAGDQLDVPIFLPTAMRATPSAALITVGNRSNLSSASVLMNSGGREGRFSIVAAAAGALYQALSELWEFNARL
jgi:hypothetical protein